MVRESRTHEAATLPPEARVLRRLCDASPHIGQTTWYGLQKVVNERGQRAGQLHHTTAKKLLDGGLRAVKGPDIRAAVLRALGVTHDDYERAVEAERATASSSMEAGIGAALPSAPAPAVAAVPTPPAWGLVREADAADPLGVPGAESDDDLTVTEVLGPVTPTVSARLAQLDAVLAREAPQAEPVTGTPPDWPARVAWFTRIGERLAEWQESRARRYAPDGGSPRRAVPCEVWGGDYEHGTNWTLADAVLHLVAFDPHRLTAAAHALADADTATRAQLAAALLWVWRVVRPESPVRLLAVLDAFAVRARLATYPLAYGFPRVGAGRRALPIAVPRMWREAWGDDVHTTACGRPPADWARSRCRSMLTRQHSDYWPAFTLGVVWLCTPVVVRRAPETPAAWLALNDAALGPAVTALRAEVARLAVSGERPHDIPGELWARLPTPDTLRSLTAAVMPPAADEQS